MVYPLNKKNDQILNSLIVDREKIGLSRNINQFESLCDDIENIKNNSYFLDNIQKLSDNLNHLYNSKLTNEKINNIFRT